MATQTVLARLNEYIEDGKRESVAALDRIEREIPADLVVSENALTVLPPDGAGTAFRIGGGAEFRPMHDNAFRQALTRTAIPNKFAEEYALQAWGREMIAENLTTIYGHSQKRTLLRSVDGTVRGLMSDSFRRLDARPTVQGFIEETQRAGAIVVGGRAGDLNVSIRAILPEITYVGDDPVVRGIEYMTSDYGHGAQRLAEFVFRLICLNGMIGEKILRTVHLGRRLDEDIAFSERTYRLDTRANASAVRDLVQREFSAPVRESRMAKLLAAQGTGVDIEKMLPTLKKTLSQAETEAVTKVFTFGDETKVPAGSNAWRLAQSLSYVAKTAATPERALDLEVMAGAIIANPRTMKLVEAIAA